MKSYKKKRSASNHLAASILLIVFMVVISVAVSAFTGTHAIPSPLVEDLTVTSVTFSGGNTIQVAANNSGTLDFAVAEVWINNEKQAFITNPSIGMIPPNGSIIISVAYGYVNETSYHIKIVSDRTNEYFASATALYQTSFNFDHYRFQLANPNYRRYSLRGNLRWQFY
jgi:hypothetical protein